YVPTLDEEIARLDSLTAEQIRRLYKEQLGSAGQFAAVGDFDPAEARQWLDKTLRDWKSPVSYVRVGQVAKTDISPDRQDIVTPDKASAVYAAGHLLAMTDADPDYAALEVANFILGGNTLASRLGNRVRQKEGLSYGVTSHFNARILDKYGQFMVSAICNPQNMNKLEKAINEELVRFIKDGVTETELSEAKKAFLEQFQVQRASDAYLVEMLGSYLFVGRTFAFNADMEKKVADLNLAEVNRAIQRHWSAERLVTVRGGDFKKAK